MLHSLLSLVSKNLERLSFMNSSLLEQETFPEIQLPELKRLRYNINTSEKEFGMGAFISMASTSSLKTFFYGKPTTVRQKTSGNADVLEEFIKRQERLSYIYLLASIADPVIEYWITTTVSNNKFSLVNIENAGKPMRPSH